MKTLITCTIFLIAAQCLGTGTASADDIIVPESWAGIWETTTTEMDCETFEVISVSTTLDTLCAGDILNPENPDPDAPELVCTGTVTDDTIHFECSFTMEILPGCSVTFSFVSDGTRNGDTSSGVTIQTTTYTGAGCFFPDTCTRNESTSVRIGVDPGCEQTPVDSHTWGTLKSSYR
jgi:hypothetical protein